MELNLCIIRSVLPTTGPIISIISIYLFIDGLLNEPVNSSDCIANDE
jgi:hypothetical protein